MNTGLHGRHKEFLSKGESVSVNVGGFSDCMSGCPSDIVDLKKKLYDYNLQIEQKEHSMKKKQWDSHECLRKSHQKWIYFVKYIQFYLFVGICIHNLGLVGNIVFFYLIEIFYSSG